MENNELDNRLTELDKDENNRNRRLQAYALMIFSILVLILLVVAFYFNVIKDDEEDKKQKDDNSHTTRVMHKDFEREKKATPTLKEIMRPFNPPQIEPIERKPLFTEKEKINYNPMIVKGSSKALIEDKSSPTFKTPTMDIPTSNFKDSFNPDYVGEVFQPSSASVRKFDPNFLLPKGTYIGCSLNTRLVSSIKGGISCTVSDNVYSANGNILLVERGSKITGMFKNDQMNDGVNRIFVIWQEITTPNNLVIPVFSGASDTLGGSGIEGWVNHKWMLRFGSAIMLSAVDDIFNVLAYQINDRNNTEDNNIDYTENTRENAKDMASIALENFINIKPTLYKNQGDLVGVYVNRDIDFSKVYKLSKNRD
ncbi:type IV secretion system protein VirB10 [Halarcobacter mediterraneus]|uniref:Type IV secretion system protein VirB10 n=1 Tax=Halarcobacter mediterraneus TaxID=2023153 RepID=A0A4Q1AV05_9BACT|nr:type IV secretion system protein VirB10 [Halarcobacter mediterraneus]RXK13236.1 type IV secretion system protein VirB10 [Halarcobacter mediterraneus]